jgi:hypothetical protein
MRTKIDIIDETWEISTDDLKFTDATLNQFFEKVSGIIDYVGAGHAKAMFWASKLDHEHKQKFIEKFKEFKNEGKSDKNAELCAEGEAEVSAIKLQYLQAKYVKDRLYAHLSALNNAREDAHNRGHMLRKELDKLNMEIRSNQSQYGD